MPRRIRNLRRLPPSQAALVLHLTARGFMPDGSHVIGAPENGALADPAASAVSLQTAISCNTSRATRW
jgi:hypothetical protein